MTNTNCVQAFCSIDTTVDVVGTISVLYKEGFFYCTESKEFNPPLFLQISNLIPGVHTNIGFYLINEYEQRKNLSAFTYSDQAINTDNVYQLNMPIEDKLAFSFKLKPIIRGKFTLGLSVYTREGIVSCIKIAELYIVGDRTMRYHVHGRNPKSPNISKAEYNQLLIEIDILRKENAELKQEVKVMYNTLATFFPPSTRGGVSPSTRGDPSPSSAGPIQRGGPNLSENLMNVTFRRCINNNWIDNLPKLDGRIVISTPSHSFNFEDKDSIKLEIVNLHPFAISFLVFYKSHESKKYTKLPLSDNQTLQPVPSNFLENSDGPHTAAYPLPSCDLPDSVKVHEVPATDYYLFIVSTDTDRVNTIQLVRKVNIYNKNQAILEKIKDDELDMEAQKNSNPNLEGSLNKLSVSEK